MRITHQRVYIRVEYSGYKTGSEETAKEKPKVKDIIGWTGTSGNKSKGKGKVCPRTGHEGQEGESSQRSTFSLTSGLNGVDGRHNARTPLTPGMTR